MEEAYLKARANGTLPANARQIMYAARPHIQATADATSEPLRPVFHAAATARLHRGDRRRLERRLRRSRPFHEPHSRHEVRPRNAAASANYLATVRSYTAARAQIRAAREALPDAAVREHRLWRRAVRREGRLHAAVRGSAARRALRPRHHEHKGHVASPPARQLVDELCGTARHPAAPPARLRQVRLLHRRHAAAGHPPLHVHAAASRSSTSVCGWRTSTGSKPRK